MISHRSSPSISGVVILATVYSYFLIFAQFAFLRLVQADGLGALEMRIVMGIMALAGIGTSLATAWAFRCGVEFTKLLLGGFVVCGSAALMALVGHGLATRCGTSALIGVGLGIVTVSLAATTPLWFPTTHRGAFIGLGTGLGYAVCNIPAVFAASPQNQALLAMALSSAGALAVGNSRFGGAEEIEKPRQSDASRRFQKAAFSGILTAFLALVWLDSAAFFIMQATPMLNRFGWASNNLQWSNAGIHLAAACLGGWWLDRGKTPPLLVVAFGFLATASLCVGSHHLPAAEATHWLYAAGVSLYSTALVFVPASVGTPRMEIAAWRAGVLYAVAGWIGSALGIGMAQDLHRIPPWFLWAAGSLIAGSLLLFSKKTRTSK